MKNLFLLVALLAAVPALAQTTKKTTTKKATVVKKAPAKATTAKKTTTTTPKSTTVATPAAAPVAPLTQAEAASGLREALTTGVTKAVAFASEPDGFNLNDDIRIQFPPDAQLVATTLGALPLGKQAVEQATNLLNRAAEAAAPQAKDIFLNAVQQLTLTDALSLVTSSQKDAATQLLRKNSEAALNAALRPSIVQSLDQVGANAAYSKLIERYNKIPLMTPASTNLTDYVTKETVDGLFILLAQQEAKIRQNPAAQSTAILKRVFGGK
ncbi:DUF4197 domain-containing protein [Hymenobacter sp. BRD67]|uniref:DUF4197 domain-containing protein n=1 Tax=Hymenobacter sp. BRD67 TaxID=2675877 RepID=UPI001563FADD|nr:DUF4197 domain-containing protein [Hymenobacter sp. BRD67]QKG52216.1 DUF4197 domain-containing protein [Hymenobacter sp. BRD67]